MVYFDGFRHVILLNKEIENGSINSINFHDVPSNWSMRITKEQQAKQSNYQKLIEHLEPQIADT